MPKQGSAESRGTLLVLLGGGDKPECLCGSSPSRQAVGNRYLCSQVARCGFSPFFSPGLLQSLSIFLEALEGVQSVIPKDKFLAITSAVFYQVRGAYPCAQSSFPLG